MRLMMAFLLLIPMGFAVGCGSGRPNPKNSPDFNQESYDNVDAVADEMKDDAAR